MQDEEYANQGRGTSKEAAACVIVERVYAHYGEMFLRLRRENISPAPHAAFDVSPL